MKLSRIATVIVIILVATVAGVIVRQNFSPSDIFPVAKYADDVKVELDLLSTASTASQDDWGDYIDSVGPGLLGIGIESDSRAANEALASIKTYQRRASSLSSKLKSISAPKDCQGFHIVLKEYSDLARDHAIAMIDYIESIEDQDSLPSSISNKLSISVNQLNSIRDDVRNQGADCS